MGDGPEELRHIVVRLTIAERAFLKWVANMRGTATLDMPRLSKKVRGRVLDMVARGFVLTSKNTDFSPTRFTLTDFGVKLVEVMKVID